VLVVLSLGALRHHSIVRRTVAQLVMRMLARTRSSRRRVIAQRNASSIVRTHVSTVSPVAAPIVISLRVLLHQLHLPIMQVFCRLLALDVDEEAFVGFEEVGMSETLLVLYVARLVEVIHVQLPHEGREVVMFEVLWQHFLGKLV